MPEVAEPEPSRYPPVADQVRTVAAGMVVLVLITGVSFYSFPVYVRELTAAGLPLTGVSAGTTVAFVVGAVVAIPFGRLLRQCDVRWFLVAGGVSCGGGLVLLGHASSIPEVLVAHASMGVSFLAFALLPLSVVVVRMVPPAGRPAALAGTTMGTLLGGLLVTPLGSWLTVRWGFATALTWCGIVVAALVAVVTLVVLPVSARRPAPKLAAVEADPAPPSDLARVLRLPTFWLLSAGLAVVLLVQVGLLNHLVQVGHERGMADSAILVPVLTAAAIASRAGVGPMLRRVPFWWFTVGVFGIETLSAVVLAVAWHPAWIMVGAGLLGISIGCASLVQPLAQIEAFGTGDFARINPVIGLAAALGQAFGAVLLAVLHSLGGYVTAFTVAAGIGLIGTALLLWTGRVVAGRASRPT